MKRLLLLTLALAILCSGCTTKRTDVTPEEVIDAYEAAGYAVWFEMYDEPLADGQIGAIRANHPDAENEFSDYVYFYIFDDEEAAEAYKETDYHPVAMGLFSVIFGYPSWVRWEVCGNILAEYSDPDFYDIFEGLLKSK